MEKKKNMIIVLLLVIIGVLACFGVKFAKELYELKTQNTTNNTENNRKETSSDTTKTQEITNNTTSSNDEIELTDASLKSDISKKASIILTMGDQDADIDINHFGNTWTLKIIDLTDIDKLNNILNANKKNAQTLTADMVMEKIPTIYNEKKSLFPDLTPASFLEQPLQDYKIISNDVVAKQYQELYNLSMPTITKDEHLGYCPFLNIDPKTNIYMYSYECGGMAYPNYAIYKYKYTTLNDKIFVYVSIAQQTFEEKKVYKGLESTEENYLYTESSLDKIESDLRANPTKYELYKLVFEKNDDGNYYYKNTEKMN